MTPNDLMTTNQAYSEEVGSGSNPILRSAVATSQIRRLRSIFPSFNVRKLEPRKEQNLPVGGMFIKRPR